MDEKRLEQRLTAAIHDWRSAAMEQARSGHILVSRDLELLLPQLTNAYKEAYRTGFADGFAAATVKTTKDEETLHGGFKS